jgi:endonuclease III
LSRVTNNVLSKLEELGEPYHSQLGIDLQSGDGEEVFKWFLASILFGARIPEEISVKTYKEFEKEGLLSPRAIIARGWSGLVAVLDRGGYVRYDFSTASQLLEACDLLLRKYGGDLNKLHEEATNPRDLERRLMEFKGVGPATASIFLREMRGTWDKADPLPQQAILIAAKNLGLIRRGDPEGALQELRRKCGEKLPRVEVALSRIGRRYCQKGRCESCPVGAHCRLFKRGEKGQKGGESWPRRKE